MFPSDICRVLEPPYRAALAGTPLSTEVHFQNRVYRMYTLPVPDAHRISEPGQVAAFDFAAHGPPYVLKSIPYDLKATVTELRQLLRKGAT